MSESEDNKREKERLRELGVTECVVRIVWICGCVCMDVCGWVWV